MNKPLDQLTKAELIALLGEQSQQLESKDRRIEDLEGILAKFQKMLFGQKRERFESSDQLSLPFETP
ncbi:transposase, partial [Algoriphagus sp. PAP.12]